MTNLEQKTFLSAEWKDLIFVNYVVDSQVLKPMLPKGTTISEWEGKTFISLVAFKFIKTKILGIPALLHQYFSEINLRFYVQRKGEKELKEGVVFIKEVVPSKIISGLANLLYRENYMVKPMETFSTILPVNSYKHDYKVKNNQSWNKISVTVPYPFTPYNDSDKSQYITEHYWGYAKRNINHTVEYRVDHPTWPVYEVTDLEVDLDFDELYGCRYEFLSDTIPESVFYCKGSDVQVKFGKTISK